MACKFNSSDITDPLEQFIVSSRSTKGEAAAELIKQVLETENIYSFGLLLRVPNIMDLSLGPYDGYFKLLQIFSYGTYLDYLKQKNELPELTPAQLKKLRILTIVLACAQRKYVSYSSLLNDTGVENIRELEDLFMEAMYADLIQGKLNQKDSRLEVNFSIGRDFKVEELTTIIYEIDAWSETVSSVLEDIKGEIKKSVKEKQEYNNHKTEIDNKVLEMKKQLKLQAQDELLLTDKSDAMTLLFEKSKKTKQKTLRSHLKLMPR